jgi:hypothetical protein
MADALEQALGGALSAAPITGSEATVYSDNPRLKISTNGAAVITAAPRSSKGSPLLWAAIAAAVLIGGIALAIFSSGGAAPDTVDTTADTQNDQKANVAAAGAAPPAVTATPVVTAEPAVAPVPSASAAPSAGPASVQTAAPPTDPGLKKVSSARKPAVKSAQTAAPTAPVKPPEMTKPNAADLFSDRQ